MKKELKIYLGADHAGFALKEKIKPFLKSKRIRYEDLGTSSEESVDYPDFAFKVGEKVAADKENKGILVCGSGIGICIAANKVKGIRAAIAYDENTAKISREHNDSNIICLRGRDFSDEKNLHFLDIWLNTDFSKDERHARRLRKISEYEEKN